MRTKILTENLDEFFKEFCDIAITNKHLFINSELFFTYEPLTDGSPFIRIGGEVIEIGVVYKQERAFALYVLFLGGSRIESYSFDGLTSIEYEADSPLGC